MASSHFLMALDGVNRFSTIDQVNPGETIVAHINDGTIEAEVIHTHERPESDL